MEKIKNNTKSLGFNSLISNIEKVYFRLASLEEMVLMK